MSALPLTPRHVRDAAETPLHEPCVLLKLGEIVLKGKNRQQFERLLHANIRRAVRDIGVQIWQREGVIVLRVAPVEGAAAKADVLTQPPRNSSGVRPVSC